MRFSRYFVAASIALTCIATPSFASAIVKVVEGGEGGGPMTLTLDQSTIKAGETTFMVHNNAMTEEHEMVLVKLESTDQIIHYIDAKQRIDEKQLKRLGEVSELKPGANDTRSRRVSADLQYQGSLRGGHACHAGGHKLTNSRDNCIAIIRTGLFFLSAAHPSLVDGGTRLLQSAAARWYE
jgi:uncharacterized cupredoxin-like copper-binding protein